MDRVHHAATTLVRLSRQLIPVAATLLLAFFAYLSLSPSASATPTTMNFQGRLLDAAGVPVADGLYNMQFKLYDASTGGTQLWTETRENSTPDYRVQVTNGLFTAKLGQRTALSASLFSGSSVYFEITQATPATATCSTAACASWESPMTPRHQMSTSAYAFNSDTLDGLDSTAFAASSGSGNYIQNTMSLQAASNFWISGTGRADTSILTPTLDTATAVALSIGTTNATSINLNQDTVLAAGQSITITGGNTASRPAGVDGMVYYDTDTKQLLVYNGTTAKWQADKSDAILVAASDSSAKDKAAADYLGDGDTAAAGDGDQVEINQALTAGSGKKVVLLAGTYTIDAAISVPNNTTLAGVGTGTLITIPNSFNTHINAITNTTTGGNGTGITIRDLKLDGNKANQTSGTMRGVYFDGVGSGTGSSAVQGGTITNVKANNWRNDGIYLISSSNNTLTGNTAQGNTNGIYLLSSSNNTLTGNTAQGNGNSGIFLFSSSSNNTITGNTTQGNGGSGIYLNSSSNNTITGNTAQGNTSTGIYLSSSSNNNTVSGNTAQGNGGSGIYLISSSNNTVSGNTAQGNTSTGIYLSSSSNNNTVSGNKLHDNGGATDNNGIYIDTSDSNTITGNSITDTSCTTTCYAINIFNSTSDTNYLANNTFSTSSGTATINDAGTGTIYAGQSMTQGGLNIRFRQANSTTAFNIQNANGISVLNVDTTNGELELGNYNGGTNPVAGKIVIANATNANTVTIQSAAQTGNYTASIPVLGANDTFCMETLGNCAPGAADFIQNQNASAQTANYWITGSARADTSVLTPTLDTATAVALNIGTTNATTINLNQDTVLAAGQSITITGGNTASRPAGTDGMVYYDTDTKQLLVYNGTTAKWQADKSDAILVAASDSSAKDKAAADYLGDGDTAAAGDGDQVQINQALTAGSGKKVVLLAGTYTIDAAISVPNDTTLAGVGTATPGTSAGTLITIPNSFNASINAITNTTTGGNGTGITIRDLKLDGNKANQTSGTMRGVYFDGVGSGTGSSAVQGGTITNVKANNWRNDGIYLNSSSNNTITGNTTQGNTYGIFLATSSSNNTITGNTTQGNTYGITLSSSSSNNTITGNTAQGNTNNGIHLSSSSNNTISGNTAQGNGNSGIFLFSSSNNTLTGNTAQGNTNYGIYLSSSSNNTLTSNTTQGNNYGIGLSSSSNNTITGNTTQGNNTGIYLSSSNNTISGNTAQGNTTYGISLSSSSSNNTVSGNKIHDNGGATANNGMYINASDSNTITGNSITDTSCTTTCYAINIANSTSDTNYLADNNFSTTAGTATINDAGTNTIYAGQAMTQGGLDIRFKQANSTTAFTIQNASGTSLFTADTTNMKIVIAKLDVTGLLTVSGHIASSGTAPTIAAGAAACTTPTVAVAGTDTAGMVTITTGTGCAGAGKLATVTFNAAYGAAPRVTLTAANANASGLQTFVDDATIATTTFDVNTNTGPANSTVYKWYYQVIQ